MKTTVNGITMAYEEKGTGPAVVLLHGFPFNHHQWRPQIDVLTAAGFRVVAPDLRGFGETEVGSGPVSVDGFADDVIGLLNYLGIGRAVIVGMSMGGYVLLNLLDRYPRRVAAAAFVATRSRADDVAEKMRRSEMVAGIEAGEREPVLAELVGRLFAETEGSAPSGLMREVRGWLEAVSDGGLTAGLLAMRERKDYTVRVRGFAVPSLVVSGDRDRVNAPEHSRFLAAALPNCCSRTIGGGHLVNLERPAEFNDCLLDFLQGLSRSKPARQVLRDVA